MLASNIRVHVASVSDGGNRLELGHDAAGMATEMHVPIHRRNGAAAVPATCTCPPDDVACYLEYLPSSAPAITRHSRLKPRALQWLRANAQGKRYWRSVEHGARDSPVTCEARPVGHVLQGFSLLRLSTCDLRSPFDHAKQPGTTVHTSKAPTRHPLSHMRDTPCACPDANAVLVTAGVSGQGGEGRRSCRCARQTKRQSRHMSLDTLS